MVLLKHNNITLANFKDGEEALKWVKEHFFEKAVFCNETEICSHPINPSKTFQLKDISTAPKHIDVLNQTFYTD